VIGDPRRGAAAPGDDELEADTRRAEAFLHDIAVKLAHVPLGGPERELHLRALALKRDVARWRDERPDGATVQKTLEVLAYLDRESREALLAHASRVGQPSPGSRGR